MNDKISRRPPSLYTREEEAMEQYAHAQEQDTDDKDMICDAGIETNKPTGVYRFGKALANAFKPFSGWQGMWKEKEKERSTSPEKNILQERQVKAAEAYAELKKSGYKGTQKLPTGRQSLDIPGIKYENTENHRPSFRDSGIDMDEQSPSSQWESSDQLKGLTEALLAPSPVAHRSVSPFSATSSRRKSSLQLRKPSFQSLKKVKSQIHLSPGKRHSETPAMPSIETTLGIQPIALSPPPGPGLRREPSKKDIAKQYRLSKKVSDLENKLETARRELELSISTAPPVPDLPSHVQRTPFKPGALPSLPSERNMSPQKADPPPPVPKLEAEVLAEVPKHQATRRRSGRVTPHANAITSGTPANNAPTLEVAKAKRESSGPRKSSDTHRPTPTGAGVSKRLPKLPSKTPNNTPVKYDDGEPVPPIPKEVRDLETNKEDQPTPVSKVTDHTSVSHNHRPASPFLGRPAASSMRTRSKRGGVSPPPPSLSSARKLKMGLDANELTMEGVECTDRIGELVGLKLGKSTSANVSKSGNSKGNQRRTKAQNEYFEWDDDVF